MADPSLLLFLLLLVAIPDPSLLLTHTFPERLPYSCRFQSTPGQNHAVAFLMVPGGLVKLLAFFWGKGGRRKLHALRRGSQ